MLGLPSVHGLQVAVKQLVSAEDSEACAVLLADGTVYTWGFNAYGELGDGTTTERLTPVLMPGLSGITQIAQAATTCWPREPAGSSGPEGATITGS